MSFRLRSLILFFAAFLCLLAGWLVSRPSGRFVAGSEQSVAPVETRIDSSLARANRQAFTLEKELLSGHKDFNALLKVTQYPVFIFENDKLVFWSDNTTLSEFEDLHDLKEEQAVENRFGKFLVVKHAADPDFIILVCVPLEITYGIRNRYLVSGLNREVFGDLKASIVIDLAAKLPEIYSPDGHYLFSIKAEKESQLSAGQNALANSLYLLAVVLAIGWLWQQRQNFIRQNRPVTGSLLFITGLLALRFVMLYFNFPTSGLRIGLFDPRHYAASFWSPSLGDLLINALLFLCLGAELIKVARLRLPENSSQLKMRQAIILKLGILAGFYFLLLLLYHFYNSLYTNSSLILDITQSLDFDAFKIAVLVAILLHTAAFMAFSYVLMLLFFALHRFSFNQSLYLLFGLALVFTFVNYLELPYGFLVLAAFLFTALLLVWEVRKHASGLTSRRYFFAVLVFALSAWAGSMALYWHYHEQLQIHKRQFARSLFQENDVVSEYLLETAASAIEADPLIRQKLTGAVPDQEFIEQKIVKYYLRGDFEKYEVSVSLFDAAGKPLNEADSLRDLSGLQQLLKAKGKPASYRNMFLLQSPEILNSHRYIKIIPVAVSAQAQAAIVLELQSKKLTPRSVIPELLVDEKFVQPLQSKSLSYAVYRNKQLISSEGDYDYGFRFDPNWLETERIFTTGRTGKNRDHLAIKQSNDIILVISTNKYLLRDIWSNFSFLFLLHTLVFLAGYAVYSLVRGKFLTSFRNNFSTKIQIFLNFGIMLPLLLISISIGSLITGSYKNDLTDTYEKRGQLIQDNLTATLTNGRVLADKSELETILTDFSSLSETDINFYDAAGKLQASSQPLIFDAGLLSKLINPQAFAALTENHKKNILLGEKAGLLNFSSLYLPVYGNNQQELLGFIGLPFFDSEKDLNLKLIELTTTILNIFTIIFIGFMALTYLAARVLTVPLSLITEKLKQTTLTGQNERLTYTSNDEIGLLVKEYNQMISKLEESRNELALKEKEAAWREMARQVAHEIKNPLTPMKLSLQYLQKAIAEKRGNVEELISKISQTLITNIDILSDIATSFSSFTSLPELKTERINLATVLKRSVDLNFDPATSRFEVNIPNEQVGVLADENLMTRTFNNLFLNALQAIPAGRQPFIEVGLRKDDGNKALISIRDNGTGIPAEVQDKVFIPNFSTKYSGSGIGLAVAKKGIESAGGRIWFETVENEGTTFFIELPLA